MRLKAATVQQFTLGLTLLAALCWNLAHGSEIKDLQLQSGAAGTRAELRLDTGAPFKVLSLANPDRLVVDLPGATLGRGLRLPGPAGLVTNVRTGTPVPGTTRIVFELAAPVVALKPRLEPGADGARLVLEWPGDGGSAIAAAPSAAARPASVDAAAVDPTAASTDATSRLIARLPPPATAVSTPDARPAAARSSGPSGQPTTAGTVVSTTDPARVLNGELPPGVRVATGIPTRIATGVPTTVGAAPAASPPAPVMPAPVMARGMRPLMVAIDPGHGGQDPGAIGPQGRREKDITLAIARELARQVNATPGLKAYLTRDNDVYIPLPRRAQLARAAKADIFVSIHADAAENRNAKGSSVYVLSLRGASSQRARWLADKENAADLIGGKPLPRSDNTLTSVLLDLTQSGHMKASEDAAGHVLSGLKRVGNNHKPNIERANFAVLRTSDMPAMLVETAFISNAEEEQRLADPAHQRTLARAVLDGINTYFISQPPPGTLYAARAASGAAGVVSGGSP